MNNTWHTIVNIYLGIPLLPQNAVFLVHNRRNVTQLHLPATHSALLIGKATFFRGDNNFVLLDTVPHPMGATHVLLWDLKRNETLVVGASPPKKFNPKFE